MSTVVRHGRWGARGGSGGAVAVVALAAAAAATGPPIVLGHYPLASRRANFDGRGTYIAPEIKEACRNRRPWASPFGRHAEWATRAAAGSEEQAGVAMGTRATRDTAA